LRLAESDRHVRLSCRWPATPAANPRFMGEGRSQPKIGLQAASPRIQEPCSRPPGLEASNRQLRRRLAWQSAFHQRRIIGPASMILPAVRTSGDDPCLWYHPKAVSVGIDARGKIPVRHGASQHHRSHWSASRRHPPKANRREGLLFQPPGRRGQFRAGLRWPRRTHRRVGKLSLIRHAKGTQRGKAE
jgi:hypothetical protein